MARSFNDHRRWKWEYQGSGPTPFAWMGKERPLVAMFKHVARLKDGTDLEGLQCRYPNEVAYTLDQLKKIEIDPIGTFRHGMHAHELKLAAIELEQIVNAHAGTKRLNDAVTAFTAASEEELAAHLPKRETQTVVLAVTPAPAARLG